MVLKFDWSLPCYVGKQFYSQSAKQPESRGPRLFGLCYLYLGISSVILYEFKRLYKL